MADLLAQVGEGPISMTALLNNVANEPTFKVDHQFNENWQLSGTYLYYKSEEPANPFYSNLRARARTSRSTRVPPSCPRREHIALNLTNIPSDDSVVTVRYGYNRFYDTTTIPDYDIGSLGFSSDLSRSSKGPANSGFPSVFVEGYGENENATDILFGSWARRQRGLEVLEESAASTRSSWAATPSRVASSTGGIGVDTFLPGYGAAFYFTPGFTQGPSAVNPAAGSGDAFASFLLGQPNADSNFVNADARPTSSSSTTPVSFRTTGA